MTMQPGTRIGAYEVIGAVGAGGMGAVYCATDPRLDRRVAIKLLPEKFWGDRERVARFQREARILAALNHPNIAALYGLEERDGQRFLVLELVDGATLEQRLAENPIAVEQCLEIGRDIARAVEAAHNSGIVHRDLKPANIKLTPDGQVKVLDFGLAKATDDPSDPVAAFDSPTITARFTAAGTVLGTAPYMSPEQARGRAIDKRTDIWSFGCVLYECLTGARPFQGDTVSDVVARILERDPDFDALPAGTPVAIRNLVVRCLEKDPRRRLRDIGDALLELEQAIETRAWTTSAMALASAAPPRHRRGRRALMGTLLFAAGAVSIAALYPGITGRSAAPATPLPTARLTLDLPMAIDPSTWELSPQGRTLAWIARDAAGTGSAPTRIYVRHLDDDAVEAVAGTEGANSFRFTMDGAAMVFTARVGDSAVHRFARVPVDGRTPPMPLCDWDPMWRSWTVLHDGSLLVMGDRGHSYVVIPARGGKPSAARPLTCDFTWNARVEGVLPDDRGLLLTTFWWDGGFREGLAVADLETDTAHVLTDDGDAPSYHPAGTLTFTRDDTLFAAPFDLARLQLRAPPQAVVAGLRTANAWDNAAYGLATDGTLVFAAGGQIGRQRRVIIVDRTGAIETWSDDRRTFEPGLSVSRDGRQLAVVCTNLVNANYELWVSGDVGRRVRSFASVADADLSEPCWSPDGKMLAYVHNGNSEHDGLYVAPVDDITATRRLIPAHSDAAQIAGLSWDPDSRHLLACVERRPLFEMVRVDTLHPDTPPTSIRLPAANMAVHQFATASPDGRWLAYGSIVSGTYDIQVCALGPDGPVGESITVAQGLAGRVRWSHDSTALYWLRDERLYESTLSPAGALIASPPRVVLDVTPLRTADTDDPFMSFDVLPDGRFVFVQKGEDETDIRQLRIILNWTAELDRKLNPGQRQ